MSGNTVSHAHNKSRRRFLPNLQRVSLYSQTLKQRLSLKIAVSTLRAIEAKGGIDAWVLGTSKRNQTSLTAKLKKQMELKTPSNSVS